MPAIILSLLLAMILRTIALPTEVIVLSPDWLLLTCLYWSLKAPTRFGIWSAWLIGLLTDVLTGRVLGQYALAYAISTYLCATRHKRFHFYAPIQQALFILVITLFARLVIFVTDYTGNSIAAHSGWYWLSCLSSALVWLLFSNLWGKLRKDLPSSP